MGETCPLCGEDLEDPRRLPTHLPQCPAELDDDLDDDRDDGDRPLRH
jgi:hypothetical protein